MSNLIKLACTVLGVFASSSAFAQTGACQQYNNSPGTYDKCWCDSGQPIGSCFSRLSERGMAFPTYWGIVQAGPFYGYQISVNSPANIVDLYTQGVYVGSYPTVTVAGEKFRYRSDIQGDYALNGSVSFYLGQSYVKLTWTAAQVGDKTGIYNINKQVCIDNGVCYVAY